jgi:hypothetical protein
MKFDIIITHIAGAKAKNIIARHLAHDPSISLQKAMSLLENPPVVYMTGVLKDDALYQVRQLEKIQVTAKLVEVQLAQLHPHAADAAFVPEHDAQPQQQQQPQQSVPHAQPVPHPAVAPPKTPIEPKGPEEPVPDGPFKKNKIIAFSIAAAVIVVIPIAVLTMKKAFDWNHAFSLDWSKAGLVSNDTPSKKAVAKKPEREHGRQDSTGRTNDRAELQADDATVEPNEATEGQKSKADACVDSGKNAPDISQAISFYQLAIAFNKKNVTAWYALHSAYASAGMETEAANTEKTMQEMFGNNIFSIAKIVEPFGVVKSASYTSDRTYRIEYQTREPNPEKRLLDSYLVMKVLINSCLCDALSLYIRTSGSAGMLAYIRTASFPASFDEYKASAHITYLK